MSSSKIDILVINGIGSKGTVDVVYANPFGKISYNTDGSCNIFTRLPRKLININHFIVDHLERQEMNLKYILKHDMVLCEISDPDSHSMALAKTRNIYDVLKNRIPWINNPHLVPNTSRDTMSQILSDIDNVIAPKALKLKPATSENIQSAIENNNFSLPVLIRPTGSHGGVNLILIESLDELQKVDLSVYEEIFVTEYADFEDDNIFTKYRFAVVAGEPFLRHVIFSDRWVIHSESRKYMTENPELQLKEAEIIENFEDDFKLQIKDAVYKIYEKIGLDYFGIDCAIRNNKLILFEVNATMNMLVNNQPIPNIWEKQIDRIVQALVDNLIIARVKK